MSYLDKKIAFLRESITQALTERNAKADELRELRDAETPDVEAITEARAAKDEHDKNIDALEREVADLEAERARDEAAKKVAERMGPAYDEVARVGREERTYTAEKDSKGLVSFMRDAYLWQEKGNMDAAKRIERHAAEVVVEREMSERAASTGSFAGLVVPQYLTDLAALVARAGRPVANTVTRLQIPEQGMTFQVPRGTTGASAAVQATENSAVSITDEVWANVTVNVSTVSGQQQVSRQSLERGEPGLDQLIYLDIAGAYGVALDTQVISGTGSGGQQLGILNTAGINQATAFGAAATAATFYSKTAGQLNAVETTRFLAPNIIYMHPRRWNWLLTQLDGQNRPLVVPNPLQQAVNAMGVQNDPPKDIPSAQVQGYFLGLPVVLDASIPTAVGTGPEDQVIVARSTDLILWEDGDGMPRELRFEQTYGNQLTTTLVGYNYIGFTAGRYPTAVGVVGGNAGSAGFGLVAPTF